MTAFEEFGVMPEIGKAVDDMDWNLPTDVQAEAIPLILGGGDVLMAAETGSGKTGAFCLPILQITWETLKDFQDGKVGGKVGDEKSASSHWAMSFFDRGPALAVTPDGLRCQSREQREWHGCRATKGVVGKGKYYYEATVTDEGLCRLGFSTSQASLDLGTCRFGFGFGGTGKKSNNKQFDDYGGAFGKADVIGCFLNLDDLEIRFAKNGVDLGRAFSINQQFKNNPFFPAVVLKNAEMQFNFGDSPFKYPPTNGFVSFSAAPATTVVPNEKKGTNVEERKIINNAPQAIIIEPSRELAEQTLKQIQKFKKYLVPPAVTELLVVGGISINDQVAALNSGVDIVVATPGRLEDLINTGKLSLRQCRFFVLDEADGLLKGGYEKFINRIHQTIPKITSDGKRLQMIVCSATLHSFEVKKMAERLMHFPAWVDLKGQDAVPETVHHVVVTVDPRTDSSWKSYRNPIQTDGVHAQDRVGPNINTTEALSEAVKMMKAEYCVRAIRQNKMDYGIIFCRTKQDCDNLERYFNMVGGGRNQNKEFSCVCLHGDRKPQERKENLEIFKRKEVKFLICTDVAARGLDIGGLPFMINFTLPDEKTNYVHRIGRVGRAERMGLAVSLVSCIPEKVWYHGEWCPSRGKNCHNTKLTDVKGCCIWYNEPQYLADIEEHLGVTIPQVDTDIKIEADEFDGKVVYGQKKKSAGSGYEGHSTQLASTVALLSDLETQAQDIFLRNLHKR
ncbi:ATP-dependent RNA helicase Ddx1 [Eurytemora carolleeae]|uniref:ATP-dependent RNA helicase Ddx1 n=1 Tax=Eurytemora carolleeae TaxID=1294199 RepID=UPI000C764FD0|nr:ATP-dependent RNA helicase Ddx1 [Eurytemora carolleeae]|eukprot:XP_023349415.1 ATP-dependent RNA helicase Ddx1-like [Eurytemora affinis]